MASFKLKLAIDQGATFRQPLVWKSGTPPEPVNLTGYTAKMQVRPEIASPVVLLTLTTENGGITLGGATGTVDLYISAEATAAFGWEEGVYDIEFTAPNGDVFRRISGTVAISREVTR